MCWGPIGPLIGPQQIVAMQQLNKKIKCFFNYKLNARTGFLDPENMGKDTKTDFLSQILRKLLGIEYLAHLAQKAISLFAYMTEKLLKSAGVALLLILVHMICHVNDVKYDIKVNANSLSHFGKCK